MEIKVKRGLFQSPAYIIPQAFLQLAKNEITDLVGIGVLLRKKSRHGNPHRFFFERKKMVVFALFLQLANNEITDLVEKGVSVKRKESSWKSPSFFRKKKDGGIRFVSDLRKLNEVVERDAFAFPLPVIDEIIWKMD